MEAEIGHIQVAQIKLVIFRTKKFKRPGFPVAQLNFSWIVSMTEYKLMEQISDFSHAWLFDQA